MQSTDDSIVQTLENRLGVKLTKRNEYVWAFIHRSFTHEEKSVSTPVKSYKRLAFLGDAVIELAIREHYYNALPMKDNLSELCDEQVNRTRLASVAISLRLGELLRLGKGEHQSGGNAKPSILSESFEALLGALFLDLGYDKTAALVRRILVQS